MALELTKDDYEFLLLVLKNYRSNYSTGLTDAALQQFNKDLMRVKDVQKKVSELFRSKGGNLP